MREEQVCLAEKSVLFSCMPTTIVEELATLENIPFKFVSFPLKEKKMATIDIKIAIPPSIFILFNLIVNTRTPSLVAHLSQVSEQQSRSSLLSYRPAMHPELYTPIRIIS